MTNNPQKNPNHCLCSLATGVHRDACFLQLKELSTRPSIFTQYCCNTGGNSSYQENISKKFQFLHRQSSEKSPACISQTSLATQRFCHLANGAGKSGKLLGTVFMSVNLLVIQYGKSYLRFQLFFSYFKFGSVLYVFGSDLITQSFPLIQVEESLVY